MKINSFTQTIARVVALSAFTAGSALAGSAPAPAGKGITIPANPTDWLDHTIAPVTNPIYFEDAVIRNEIRPIYLHHNIDNGFVTQGGSVDVWALQARFALTDRLALIATKDGYISLDPGAGESQTGWADVALGLKYAVIDDRANSFLLTPGFTFEIPLGNRDVFQGNGDGQFDVFVSTQKGFGDLHISANAGFLLPLDGGEESTSFHYSVMVDYYLHQYFIPFVSLNGFTVVDGGSTLPIDSEGFDLINFGSSKADGVNQMALGFGFRSRLMKNLDLGVAWEMGIGSPKGLYEDRLTVDFCLRF